MYIVVLGNAIDGLRLIGPFILFEDAENWATRNSRGEPWLVTMLDKP